MTNTGDLGTVPPEVLETIFHHCNLTTLLQLRLVSRRLKASVDSSNRFPDALEVIQLNVHSSTLEEFVETAPSLPFSNFYITEDLDDTHPFAFYRDTPHLRKFMELYCAGIRTLRVSEMLCCTIETEFEFFRSLHNLRKLHIDTLSCPRDFSSFDDLEVKLPRVPFIGPNLKIQELVVDYEENTGEYLVEWIKLCPSLQIIKYPQESRGWSRKGLRAIYHGSDRPPVENWQRTCNPYVLRLGAEGHFKNLRTLDMNDKSLELDISNEIDIQIFQELSTDHKVRFENVPSSFLRKVENILPENLCYFIEQVNSLRGISQFLNVEDFLNLQVLKFSTCFEHEEESEWDIDLWTNTLPALQMISAKIEYPKYGIQKSQDFLEWLFRPAEPRTTVTELQIHGVAKDLTFGPEYLDLSFPNLTRLSLDLFMVTTKVQVERFIEVISRKYLLQELILSIPGGIPQTAFDGGNPDGIPVFLRLNHLRKLRIKWFLGFVDGSWKIEKMEDGMMGILSQMSLTHLWINSSQWRWDDIGEVPLEGIRRLLEGPLGQSILSVRLDIDLRSTTDLGDISSCLETLEKVAHGNRVARGLTSTTFEEYKASKEVAVKNYYSFRKDGWLVNEEI